jgi:hypothetical protein
LYIYLKAIHGIKYIYKTRRNDTENGEENVPFDFMFFGVIEWVLGICTLFNVFWGNRMGSRYMYFVQCFLG